MGALIRISEEVLQATGEVVRVTREMLNELEMTANKSRSGRARILLHQQTDDLVHQMIIRHPADNLDRPHRNPYGEKSFTAIEGKFALMYFSEDGKSREAVVMSASELGYEHTVRLSGSLWHTIIPISGPVVFMEVAAGPFHGNEFPVWSPSQHDEAWVDFANLLRLSAAQQVTPQAVTRNR